MLMNLSKDALKGNALHSLKAILLSTDLHNRIMRQMTMLHLLKIRTALTKNSFYFNSSVIMNRLNF